MNENIDRLQIKLKDLEALRIKKDTVSLKALMAVFEWTSKKQDHVDWIHSWTNFFSARVDGYTKDINDNIKAQKELRSEAEMATQTLDSAIGEGEEKLANYMKYRQELQYANSKHAWILETSGFWPVEREIVGLRKQQKTVQKILDEAMQAAGVPDAMTASKVLIKAQDTLLLISSVVSETMDIAEQVEGWKRNFDNLIARMNGKANADSKFLLAQLPIVEKSFKVIADAYSKHMDAITVGANKALMIDNFVAKLLPNPDLNPSHGPGQSSGDEL